MTRPVGRPMIYRPLIEALEDDKVYTPATIYEHAQNKGLIKMGATRGERRRVRLNIRHSLARFSANHFFPDMGDGWVKMRGQPPLRGWLGKRWKDNLSDLN